MKLYSHYVLNKFKVRKMSCVTHSVTLIPSSFRLDISAEISLIVTYSRALRDIILETYHSLEFPIGILLNFKLTFYFILREDEGNCTFITFYPWTSLKFAMQNVILHSVTLIPSCFHLNISAEFSLFVTYSLSSVLHAVQYSKRIFRVSDYVEHKVEQESIISPKNVFIISRMGVLSLYIIEFILLRKEIVSHDFTWCAKRDGS